MEKVRITNLICNSCGKTFDTEVEKPFDRNVREMPICDECLKRILEYNKSIEQKMKNEKL